MLFSSITFLYCFLPVVLFLYYLLPGFLKNPWLLLASLFFYGWGEPKYIVFMLVSILAGYILGLCIEKYQDTKQAKLFLICSLFISLGMLGYFKYANFFIHNINAVFNTNIGILKIVMPIGISFYTFQILSYTIDVYRKDVPAQRNLISLATYISLFPQLIAGPIVRYSDVELQLNDRKHSKEKFALGIRRFVMGLSKKILIANQLGELCDIFFASNDKSVLFYWLYTISFMLHIYFDFSGYSDMAIGLGKMLGFDFMENFNYPYIAKSITDFWRRWHISLSSWFRDYLYIPLGGSRVSKLRNWMNLMITFLVSGAWHGASWHFIAWGGIHGAYQIVGKWKRSLIKKELPKVLQMAGTFVLVCFGWMVFRANSLGDVKSMILLIITKPFFKDLPAMNMSDMEWALLVLSLLVLLAVNLLQEKKISVRQLVIKRSFLVRIALYVLGIGSILVFGVYGVAYDASQFLYFQF